MKKITWAYVRCLLLQQHTQSGFTLIEALIAVVIVTVMITAVSPIIVLSITTRVQARRVELAAQAARSYTDGVRNGTISAPNNTITLSEVSNNTFSPQRNLFASTSVPVGGSFSCPITTTGYPYCSNTSALSLYCIDLDGGGCSSTNSNDLVIQAFRSATSTSTDPNQGYLLGVRVYRADAFNDSKLLTDTAQTNNQQMTYARGLGNPKAPLVEMTTEIVTSQTKYQYYCNRFGGCQ